ncbi:Fumarate hydratase class II [Peribacillus sp. Bi96]|nr:Fumarate hydratase class II [Peribacillus sp. Bi96]
MDLKCLYEGIKDVIVEAADEIIEGKIDNAFMVDPIEEGLVHLIMNKNEIIANRALELLGHEKGFRSAAFDNPLSLKSWM